MKKRVIVLIVCFIAAGAVFGGGVYVGAATSGAGSQNDPVVSLSYLEYRLENLERGGMSGDGGTNSAYRRVELSRGERLMPGEGNTIVLYSGSCTAVGSTGLVGLTNAEIYYESYSVPLYNVCLVPDDMSGIVAGTDTVVFLSVSE